MIDLVLVEEPVPFQFAGSISTDAARAAWIWIGRDIGADLVSLNAIEQGTLRPDDIEPLIPDLLARIKAAVEKAEGDGEAMLRLRVQTGRERVRDELYVVKSALRARALLSKAQSFGKAVNSMTEDSALTLALQSMPLQDPKLAAHLFHVAVGQVSNPSRLISSVTRLAGGASEAAIARAGYAPLMDAFLAHAQNQLHALDFTGPFADIDLACRALDRFHRLIRALTGYVEFSRGSRGTQILSGITKMVSDRVEPRLKDIVTDLNQAMRRPREGIDRIDNDHMLGAVSGIYLLSAVRDCRDSLALNAVFDQAWNQTGQALELHIQRNLDLIRQQPGDVMAGARLDAAIKMAEIRFNADYADTLKRARVAAERRG